MSETNTETIDVPKPEPPTMEELEQRVKELEESGITVEAKCEMCGTQSEFRKLPEESTVCRLCDECVTSRLRESGVL